MMSVKKNITVATLAALMGIPAFGATNASHALHIPSITANAASTVSLPSSYTGHWSGYGSMGKWAVDLGRNSGYLHRYAPGDNEQGAIAYTQNSNGKYSWWPKNEIGKAGAGPAGSYFYLRPNGQLAWKEDVSTSYLHRDSSSKSSTNGSQGNNQSTNATNNENETSNAANTSTNATNTNSANNQSTSNLTQYASKSKLPQTDESNDASKARALGAVALGASASLMALSFAKKHRQKADLNTATPTESAVNNDDSDTSSNKDNDLYNMVMNAAFKNISNDLKQM